MNVRMGESTSPLVLPAAGEGIEGLAGPELRVAALLAHPYPVFVQVEVPAGALLGEAV